MSKIVWSGKEVRYWSCLDWCMGSYCGVKDCCHPPANIELTETRLTITKSILGVTGTEEQKDNVELKSIADVDVVSKPPPCMHACFCGQRRDQVVIKTTQNRGAEDKILWLESGQGQPLADQIMNRN